MMSSAYHDPYGSRQLPPLADFIWPQPCQWMPLPQQIPMDMQLQMQMQMPPHMPLSHSPAPSYAPPVSHLSMNLAAGLTDQTLALARPLTPISGNTGQHPASSAIPKLGSQIANVQQSIRNLFPITSDVATTSVAPVTAGIKRRAPDDAEDDLHSCDADGWSVAESEDRSTHWDCDQIRRKIKALIESGEVKVTHFQRDCQINSNSYGRFMKLRGPKKGMDNQTYEAATDYFQQRSRTGHPLPKRKRTSRADEDTLAAPIKTVLLEGQKEGNVRVYDSCDDLRCMIRAHMKEPNVTKAALCRQIAACLPGGEDNGIKIQSKQMDDFLDKSGPLSGNSSRVCYGAYCYFEKKRLAEGRPETEKRKRMKAKWPDGIDLERVRGRLFCLREGDYVVEDELGGVEVMRAKR